MLSTVSGRAGDLGGEFVGEWVIRMSKSGRMSRSSLFPSSLGAVMVAGAKESSRAVTALRRLGLMRYQTMSRGVRGE